MTAPSLSIPAGPLSAAWHQLRAVVPPRALAGGALVLAVAMFSHLVNGGARPALDPALPLVLAVVAAAAIGGLRGGAVAAAMAIAYGLFFYSQPPSVDVAGNGLRVLVFCGVVIGAAGLVGAQRERLQTFTSGSSPRALVARARHFSDELGESTPEQLPAMVASGAAKLAAADMAALTIVDMRTGRHVVRAVHGTNATAIGVEVLPGVGVTGQAIRDHRPVVVGRAAIEQSAVLDLRHRVERWLDGRSEPAPQPAGQRVAPAIALPQLHAGSVVATLTLGRADPDRPFTADERHVLEVVSPQIGLAVVNTLLRGQLREASLKDPLTGLYNRSYLDAALSQALALRRRMPAAERSPLSLVLFDIDGFRQLNERHGPPAADRVLRAVAALLQQRFRASDTIARVGGDGFVVVMEGADLKSAVEAAGQIRAQLREMVLTDDRGTPLAVTMSAGCALFRDEAGRSEQIIRTVEAALDTARWSGPGSIVAI